MITNTTTIRLEIEKGIRQKGHSLSSFGKQAGINRGIISGILNGNPPKSISIRQLDLMAEALGHAEGWMYEYYVDECFINEKADWRRIKAFLLRCTEIGRYDCIKEVLDRLMEDLNNTISIFGLAEELYAEGKVQESLPFYECVIENEKHQHSERLAISHYRVFRASIGENTEKSLRAVIRFEPYRNRLPENMILDALLQLANVYYTLQDWRMMEYCADELRTLLETVYKIHPKITEENINFPKQTERHVVVYYGQSFLLKSIALEHQKKYSEAKYYISGYADLTWFKNLDATGKQEVSKLKNVAIANIHNLDLLMGNIDNIDNYVDFATKNPNEILPSLISILEAANKYNFDVDNILEIFAIDSDTDINFESGYYQELTHNIHTFIINYQLALYHLMRTRYKDGVKYILKSLNLATKISDKGKILDCVSLFEQFKDYAVSSQRSVYENIIKGVNNDAQIHVSSSNGTTSF